MAVRLQLALVLLPFAIISAFGQQLSVGPSHSLTVQSDGSVCVMGANNYGQLGDATYVSRRVPSFAALSNAAVISTNEHHGLMAAGDGSVWAWGTNNYYELGDGTNISKPAPIQVAGIDSVVSVAAGQYHSLALRNDGTVWSWGSNGNGALGTGSRFDASTPAQVIELSDVVAIAAGYTHSLALRRDGTVWAWGSNSSGQLGDGTNNGQSAPVRVMGLTGIKTIAAGGTHSIAISSSDGSVWSWGSLLGNGTSNYSNVAVRTGILTGMIAIAGGDRHSVAVKSDGSVWGWGDNSYGQLGTGTTSSSSSPVQAKNVTGAVLVGAGYRFTVAIRSDGARLTWGRNDNGQFGNGTTTDNPTPSITPGCSPASTSGMPVSPRVGAASGQSVAAGPSHVLALQSNGPVCASGANNFGQLGDGTLVDRPTPVFSDLVDAISVSTNESHGIAVDKTSQAWSWGRNSDAQLGDGTTSDKANPAVIPGLKGVAAVAAGRYHSLALLTDGTVWAWGNNGNGALGNGTYFNSSVPVQVIDLTNVIAVAAGDSFSLALTVDGNVWAWGYNGDGELGNDTFNGSPSPIRVAGLTGIAAIAAGRGHALAIRSSDGTVWGWGQNNYGQLGNGSTSRTPYPVRASDLGNVVAVAGGLSHSLAVRSDGSVWAWGDNTSGELGNGNSTNSPIPVQVKSITKAVAVAAGNQFSVALLADGSRATWGSNSSGQFGTGNLANNVLPVSGKACISPAVITTVPNPTVRALAASNGYSAVIRQDGTVWTWGANNSGQLGDGTTKGHSTGAPFAGPTTVVDLSLNEVHGLAVTSTGDVWAWGNNGSGQLGDGTTASKLVPIRLPIFDGTGAAVAAGRYHSLLLKRDGTVWAWGDNGSGQLGTGKSSSTPAQVPGLTNVVAIAAGWNFSVALKNDGSVWTWGDNGRGQLGDGTYTSESSPVQVTGISGVAAVAAGQYHVLVIRGVDGTVWAWGYNSNGQLGDGSAGTSPTPVRANALAGVVGVSGGYAHSLAVKADGTVFSWGYNGGGQLGNGNTNSSLIPVQVKNLTNAVAIAAGNNHSLALTVDGYVFSWGTNDSGQFGVPSPAVSTVPVSAGNGYIACTGAECLIPPTVSVSPANLNSVAIQGTTDVQQSSLQVSGQGGSSSFSLGDIPQPWISVSPTGGPLPAVLQVRVDPTGLSAGQYQAVIPIRSDAGAAASAKVNLSVLPGGSGTFVVEAPELSFNVNSSSANQSARIFSVRSTAMSDLSLSALTKYGSSWLGVSPAQATVSPGQSVELTVRLTPTAMPGGILSDSVIVTAGDQSQEVPIKVVVGDGQTATPLYSSTALTLFGQLYSNGGPLAVRDIHDERDMILFNAGPGDLDWFASSDQPFITVSPSAASVLAPGAYQSLAIATSSALEGLDPNLGDVKKPANIDFRLPGGKTYSIPVTVKLATKIPARVTEAGIILAPGDQSSKNIDLSYSISKDANVTVTVPSAPAWLVVSPQPFTLKRDGNKATFTIQAVNFDGAKPGTVTLQFTDSDGTVNTVNIGVIPANYRVSAPALTAAGRIVRRTDQCTPTALFAVFTSPANLFTWEEQLPLNLEARIMTDCGTSVVGGAATVSFSTGEPPIALSYWPDGIWRGTWVPSLVSADPVVLRLAAVSDDGTKFTRSLIQGVITRQQ